MANQNQIEQGENSAREQRANNRSDQRDRRPKRRDRGRVENQADPTPGTTLNHNETTAEDEADEAELEGLSVSDEAQDEIKSGGPGYGAGGGVMLNHNETTARDEAEAADEALADLPVSAAQEEEIAAGGGHVKVFDGVSHTSNTAPIPGVTLNHNETVAADEAEDKDAEPAQLSDLAVNTEQSDEVKGGLQLRSKRSELPVN